MPVACASAAVRFNWSIFVHFHDIFCCRSQNTHKWRIKVKIQRYDQNLLWTIEETQYHKKTHGSNRYVDFNPPA